MEQLLARAKEGTADQAGPVRIRQVEERHRNNSPSALRVMLTGAHYRSRGGTLDPGSTVL